LDIDVRYFRRASDVLVLGLLDAQTIGFRVNVRRWASSADYVGYDLGQPVTEISWLEVPEPQRGNLVLVVRAVCEALGVALELSDEVVSLVAIAPMNHRMTARLERRKEFTRVDSSPFPYVTSVGDVRRLRKRVCH
jgi:hypothetical protein